MTSELHAGEKKKHCPWPLHYIENARSHISKRSLARMEELRLKHVADPSFSPGIAPADLFPFGWLKGELYSRSVSDINGLFEIVDEIMNTVTPDTIARVFANWIERLKQVIDTNGDYI
jgi:hypothetical protein